MINFKEIDSLLEKIQTPSKKATIFAKQKSKFKIVAFNTTPKEEVLSTQRQEEKIVQIDTLAIKDAIFKAIKEQNISASTIEKVVNPVIVSILPIQGVVKAKFLADYKNNQMFNCTNIIYRFLKIKKTYPTIESYLNAKENIFYDNTKRFAVFSLGETAFLWSVKMGVFSISKKNSVLLSFSRIHITPLCCNFQKDIQASGTKIIKITNQTKTLHFEKNDYDISKILICETCLDVLESRRIIRKKIFNLSNFLSKL